MQKRTNWTAIVVLLTVSHLSATFVYYVFIAEKEESKGGATGAKKAVIDYEAEVGVLQEQLAQAQELLHEEHLKRRRLLVSDTGTRRAHQPIELAFPLGGGRLETESNNVLPDKGKDPAQPLITVIISARNHSRTIDNAIQSVLDQTYSHWELILVDDNSQDGTRARCQSVTREHRQHPVTFVQKSSTSLVDGLNRGLQLARGDWIIALDPKDQLIPTYFADVAEGAAKDPRAQVFLGCMNLVGDTNRTWCFPDGWSFSWLTQPSDLPLGFAVRRDLISDIGGFDPACPEYIHHWNFWLSTIRHRPKVRLLPMVTLLHADPSLQYLSEPAVSDGPKRHVSRVELDEGAAMVRTLHPDVFEPDQLLMDHEVIAAMSTGSLTGLLARCYQFPAHPLLPFWKGLYWEAQNEHAEAAELMMTSLHLAQNATRFANRWQQHFWLALFQEANGSLMGALVHARLALSFNHFDELLRTVWRLERAVKANVKPSQEMGVRAVPYYWSNEEEVERIRQQSVTGKLERLADLEEALPRTRRKHMELVALLETLHEHPCPGNKAPRGSLNLVRNPHFKGRSDWFNYGLGFDIDPSKGRVLDSKELQPALSFQSFRLDETRGAMQSVKVDQKTAGPILISAWHMTQAVVGAPDTGFGLLLEVHYQNGSSISQPLVQFVLGTHGWEDVSLVVSSDRPIASIDVSILFVQHSGQLWVDNVSVTEVRKAACHCPPNTFYDPTPGQDCSPCPKEHLCVHGFKVERHVDALS